MIQGAIFDMDGTLLDSMPAWDAVGDDLLRANGITPPDNLTDTLKTLSLEETPPYLLSLGLPYSHEEFSESIITIMRENYRTKIPLKPYAKEFLAQLHKQGVRCCVATATYSGIAREALDALGVLGYFDFVVSCDEVGGGKNRPDIFDYALTRLATPKEHTLVFEDALHAVQTAKDAGFRVAALADATNAGETIELRQLADYYFASFADCDITEF